MYLALNACVSSSSVKGSARCRRSRQIPDFLAFRCFEKRDLLFFPTGIGVWEGLESIRNGRGLQMDGVSAHFEPYEFISIIFDDFSDFGIFSDGLMPFTEGPMTLRDCHEGPGTL